MAKLYFRYGTVSSAKTLNLLAAAHAYETQGKKFVVIKPAIDTRFGEDIIQSRAGLSRKADYVFNDSKGTPTIWLSPKPDCILVDEVQFFTAHTVDVFRLLATYDNIPVICYGLRSDFRGDLFDGSKRLFEIADDIQEIKSVCHYCNRKATMNLKHIDGKPTTDGPSIQLGSEELYLPTCYSCYHNKLNGG